MKEGVSSSRQAPRPWRRREGAEVARPERGIGHQAGGHDRDQSALAVIISGPLAAVADAAGDEILADAVVGQARRGGDLGQGAARVR
jgi:hypothetical protein